MKKSEVQSKLIGNDKYKYAVEFTNTFKKDVVNAAKRNLDLKLLGNAIKTLATEGKLPLEYKPHKLEGNFMDIGNVILKAIGNGMETNRFDIDFNANKYGDSCLYFWHVTKALIYKDHVCKNQVQHFQHFVL